MLEEIGRSVWEEKWQENMALPENLSLDDRETVCRFLLLRTLLNQQGETEKVRLLVQRLFAEFGSQLLYAPLNVATKFEQLSKVFRQVGGQRGRGLYRVGALGGIKPISLFLYRFAAFAFFIARLREPLYATVKRKMEESVIALWSFFREDVVLEGGIAQLPREELSAPKAAKTCRLSL